MRLTIKDLKIYRLKKKITTLYRPLHSACGQSITILVVLSLPVSVAVLPVSRAL